MVYLLLCSDFLSKISTQNAAPSLLRSGSIMKIESLLSPTACFVYVLVVSHSIWESICDEMDMPVRNLFHGICLTVFAFLWVVSTHALNLSMTPRVGV